MDKPTYSCGFLITYQMDRFLLIDKGSKVVGPGISLAWSGIGGKRKRLTDNPEDLRYIVNETPHETMVREFIEETGHEVKGHRWHCFTIKEYTEMKVFFFCAFCSPDEMEKIAKHFPEGQGPEGKISIHGIVDCLFDPELYTYDLSMHMAMIFKEARRGFLVKLDPEGVNSAYKHAQAARNHH